MRFTILLSILLTSSMALADQCFDTHGKTIGTNSIVVRNIDLKKEGLIKLYRVQYTSESGSLIIKSFRFTPSGLPFRTGINSRIDCTEFTRVDFSTNLSVIGHQMSYGEKKEVLINFGTEIQTPSNEYRFHPEMKLTFIGGTQLKDGKLAVVSASNDSGFEYHLIAVEDTFVINK